MVFGVDKLYFYTMADPNTNIETLINRRVVSSYGGRLTRSKLILSLRTSSKTGWRYCISLVHTVH